MGSEAKEMKYRRRARAPEPGDYAQCGGDRAGGGAVDWAALKRQDPAELLRQLDEIRAQITRSCEIAGPPPPPPHRVARRAVSMRPSHADPPPPPPPEYGRSRHAGRYGHGLPPSSYDQRSVCDERYGRQPSGRFRQPRPEGQWEGYGYGGQGQGSCHQSSCQCAQCVHGQRAVLAQEENIPMARFLAGQQQRPSYLFDRSSSISSEYDRRSVASSLYSHLSMSKRRVEYFRKKAENFCRPVKGGAPFVVCSSCNQLLQLPPGKCTARRQNQVQCGSCSEVVWFKLKGVKVHPLVPPSSFAVPKSVRSSDRWNRQSSGWYPEQDDDTSSFGSHRQKRDFSDNLSRSSTGSCGSIDKERVANKGSQLKPVSTRRSRFADSPKDILCQGDAESQAEAPAVRTISPQALIIEDKLVDPFSSQLKVCSGWDQIKSKRYGLNCKGDYDVRGESKSEQKSKESHQDGFGEETINRAYGQKFKQSNADWHDGHVGNKNMKKANSDDISSLGDEAMSKKYEEKSKQDDTFEVEGVSKRYGNCNKNGYNDVLEVDSITKKSEEEKGKDDCAKSLSSNCENTKIVAKNELSVNEQRDTSSRFSSEAGLDEFQSPAGKSGDSSFFGGLLKKGFKDLSLFNQSMDNVKVSINGHSISERALRRAEKKAGPVGPGSYWYDQRAGFWGVMGHECSGIIPPLIREFSYSMPKDCAGGNTGVLVNGRELHQKDFDLLVKRGLQRFTGKSYTVDISGNVIDDTTNQKLRNLGKLAPTIEKMKRGFGMHTPEETS
ncbi:uncharacterized protein [Lolium perenne]|uniref:uncharacterized protein n=1 Tax=Lolium perenne TaxID=4522 RepID=UPI0021F5DED5|nr:uncharacterized protein LOC127327817 [Lolium perenne]XP_051210577.1 uncharacterized protein LOC127327817 [Lolium perenne]